MGKKRLVIDLEEEEHSALVRDARNMNMTVANFVRTALGIPLQRQGARPEPPAKNRTKRVPKKRA